MMALPPCHLMMQFGVIGDVLDMSVYIRSNDLGLGAPFNLAQYGMLLQLMAQITGYVPGTLHYFAFDAHVYENHVEALHEQLSRDPMPLPQLVIDDRIKTLDDIEQIRTAEDIAQAFSLRGYNPHPAIKMEMAVMNYCEKRGRRWVCTANSLRSSRSATTSPNPQTNSGAPAPTRWPGATACSHAPTRFAGYPRTAGRGLTHDRALRP